MKLTQDFVLVKPIDKESAILYTKESEDFIKHGEVIAVGPGKYYGDTLVPLEYKEGDEVWYWDNHAVKFEGYDLVNSISVAAYESKG